MLCLLGWLPEFADVDTTWGCSIKLTIKQIIIERFHK